MQVASRTVPVWTTSAPSSSDAGVQDPNRPVRDRPSGVDSFMITAQDMPEEQQKTVLAALDEQYSVKEGSTATETVGASFSEEPPTSLIAIAIAVIVIIGYVSSDTNSVRIPAILALIHDVGLTSASCAGTAWSPRPPWRLSSPSWATRSRHDRHIRPYARKHSPHEEGTYGDMVDLSIRQTMVRSINTTIALLLPLLAILIFGGPTLKDFALALTIGTVAGTYSCSSLRHPMVVLWTGA